MTSRLVHLGFEVLQHPELHGTSAKVEIPIRHMAVTGQTQESGKTTALTALISRAGLPAIAFLTKRGEGEMHGRKVLPFFQERADWQFVQSILESTMKERMKFERAWIVRACQGAKTLADVQRNIVKLEESARNALSKDVYMLLGEYLQRVVPMIAKLPKASWSDLSEGNLAVMDLVAYPQELQMLVISSTLEQIHKHEAGVIAIIPEAWKFIPQGRNTPVKIVAENLAREGAALRNYLWIDSQDMAAVDKMLLRACAVWLIGVQREANEIKRALANMPAGLKKPKADAVATLDLGQFFACYGKEIRKTYVQPAWMDETAASQIAAGRLSVQDVMPLPPIDAMRRELNRYEKEHGELPPHSTEEKEPVLEAAGSTVAGEFPLGSPQDPGVADSPVVQTSAEQEGEAMADQQLIRAMRKAMLHLGNGELNLAMAELKEAVNHAMPDDVPQPANQQPSLPAKQPATAGEWVLTEQLYTQLLDRLVQDVPKHPSILQLLALRPEIVVSVKKQAVELDDSTLRGRLAILLADNFFANPATGNAAWKELERRGVGSAKPNVYRELDKFAEMGFLVKVDGGYQSVPGMKVTKKRVEAAA